MVPQTVRFELEVRWDRIERPADKPVSKLFVCETFEGMLERYRVERRRRAIADRATSARYRMLLTEHGKQAVAADADCRARHQDVIDGKWFAM